MSVRIFSNREIHQLVTAALAWKVIEGEEAAHRLGAQLLRQHIEALTWSYDDIDAEAFRRMRDDAQAYRFAAQPALAPRAATRLIDLYIYNAEEDPGWVRSPLGPLLSRLRRAVRAHGASPKRTSD